MTRPFNESYLVRVWHDGGAWRARITHIGNGEHRFFTSLEQLWLFWQEETAVTPLPRLDRFINELDSKNNVQNKEN